MPRALTSLLLGCSLLLGPVAVAQDDDPGAAAQSSPDEVFPAPPVVSAPTAPDEAPAASAPAEPTPPPTAVPAPAAPAAPEQAGDGGGWSPGPLIGGTIGCLATGGPLDIITIGGIGFFIYLLNWAIEEGGCGAALVTVIIGGPVLVIGLGAAALAGPLVPIATIIGGAVGAGLAGRPVWTQIIGGLPGLVVGLTGSGLLIASLTVLQDDRSTRGDNPLQTDLAWWLAAAGGVSALLAGPLALGGVVLADSLWGNSETRDSGPGDEVRPAVQPAPPAPAPAAPAPPPTPPAPSTVQPEQPDLPVTTEAPAGGYDY